MADSKTIVMPALSIIIPTRNEDKYLPLLLKSILKQSYKDLEIIVADADSKDKTRKIAKDHGCRIIKGGIQARGINNGAKAAKAKTLLILDADAVLPKNFLVRNMRAFRRKRFDVASCHVRARGGNLLDMLFHLSSNVYYSLNARFRPFVPSFCFFIRKETFNKTGGFDEDVPWLADLAFSNTLPVKMRYGLLPVPVELSVRMAERLGRGRQAGYMLLACWYRFLGKNYYGKYPKKRKRQR